MKAKFLFTVVTLVSAISTIAQPDRWQQRVKYTMDVQVDVNHDQFHGTQKLEYTNNSPDTLSRVFYHLYWNAFQPNSMMDARSRRQGSIMIKSGRGENPDWDGRVRDRISKLTSGEEGYQHVSFVKMNGRNQKLINHETILEVVLDKPILPHSKVLLELVFDAQVPVQIRRSGRDNASGVRYSMSQWYPKLCEYDYEGWHPTPYVGREFYGVWGDYDVRIAIDRSYIIASTGYLQNPEQIGYGYESPGMKVTRPSGSKLTWHFIAPNVHDFMWAADPEYHHETKTVRNGLVLHSFYKVSKPVLENIFKNLSPNARARYADVNAYIADYEAQWKNVLPTAAKALPYIEKTFGAYPYKQYSFVHGGDGGMEYPMATLLAGPGIGTVIHEWMHTWFQMMLGTNESLYPWMDEGFTTYAESRVSAWLSNSTDFPYAGSYSSYIFLAKSGLEEPMTTHADHYNTNFAYSIASYSKGCVFMEQLGYIVGAQVRDKILLEYYRQWRFKHPNANDFIRVAEKVSGIQLDWYKEFWVSSTKTIDYAIDSLWEENGVSKIRLRNLGLIPMPIDMQLTFKDGSKEMHYIPMYLMFGQKPVEDSTISRTVYEPWKWTHATYIIESKRKLTDLTVAEIDPSMRMADIDRKNNKLELTW